MLARWSRGGDGRRCLDGDCGIGAGGEHGNYYGDDYYGNYYGNDYYGYYGGDQYGYYGGDVYGMGGDLYGYGYYPQYVPPPAPTDRYQTSTITNGGTIEGVVTWKGAPRVPSTIPAAAACEASLANPTLQKAPSGGVAYTLVYLSDINYGKQYANVGGTLEQRGCSFAPHVQLAAPIGINLQVANHDAIAHRLKISKFGEDAGKDRVVNLALPTLSTKEVPLLAAGVYEVASDDDGVHGGAWVVVPRHPYYAITDSDGRFRLDDVPPGEYSLIAWHEPVITAADEKTGAITRGSAIEIKARIKVVAGQVTRHDVDLRQ
jgi:hypothetical protein